MINFKISDAGSSLITVTKPAGKPISLNVGEIVKADVIDLLSSGGVTLKIKGGYITARADIAFQKDSQVLLKVLSASPNELRLQFVGAADKQNIEEEVYSNETLSRIVKELSGSSGRNLQSDTIATLIKALPKDINAIPQDLRGQLQNILREALRSSGKDIQSRIEALFRDLPSAYRNQSFVQGLQLDLTLSAEKFLSDGLKSLLRDTGVALEAKLRAVAEALQAMDKTASDSFKSAHGQTPDIKSVGGLSEKAAIENDLKTNLLKLRESLVSSSENLSAKEAGQVKLAIGSIDALIRDIESYQLMSKATGSFYTFLPVSWRELKDGEIAFQRHDDEGKARLLSCRLSLDLENMGKLVVMVLLCGNEFFVSFRPEKAEFRELIEANLDVLSSQFREKGLNLKVAKILDNDDPSADTLQNSGLLRRGVNIRA